MSSPGVDTMQMPQLAKRVRRAGRSAILGAGIGLVVGILLSILLTSTGESVLLWLSLLIAPIVLLGATIGHTISGGRLAKLVNDTIGSDIAAERIKRAVAGRPEALSLNEQDRAARYAATAAVALPAQAIRWWLLAATLFTAQALRLTLGPASGGLSPDSIISATLGLASAALLAWTGIAQARTGRQARTYSSTHPLDPEHAPRTSER